MLIKLYDSHGMPPETIEEMEMLKTLKQSFQITFTH